MNTTKPMLALATLLAGALLTGPTSAEEPAVSEVNVELGATQSWTDYQTRSVDSNSLSGSLSIAAPLGKHVGVSASVARAHSDYSDPYVDHYRTDMAGSIFLRNPEIGRIGFSVGHSSVRIANMDFKTDDYTFGASAYLSSFTLALAVTDIHPQQGANDSYGAAGVAWYANPNVFLGVVAGFMDAKETYSILLEQQIGQGGFAYGLNYDSNFDHDYDRYSLDLIYRLARPKSLMDRRRKDL